MKKILIAVLGLAFAISVAAPSMALAQDAANGDPRDAGFQLVPCKMVLDKSTGQFKPDSECDFRKLMELANRIIRFLLYLSIPLVLGMIMYTAFTYLTANGDSGKVAKAKKMLVPVAIGLFWILAAYIVVYTLLDSLLKDTLGTGADQQPKQDVIFLNVLK